MRLVLSPHVDDDVIGCGGILDADTTVVYIGIDQFHVVSRAERIEEAKAVAARTGHRPIFLFGKVNDYAADFRALVQEIENDIDFFCPDEVLIPWPSYNQDHQAVYDAAMVALRPHDGNRFVKRVLLYEEPDCWWPGIRAQFVPTLFREIDIEEKLARYALMPSQVRGHRSLEHLRALAVVRGAAIMRPAAEAFHILRWVE